MIYIYIYKTYNYRHTYTYIYTHIHTVLYVCIVCTLFCTRLHLPYVVHITDVLKGIGFGSCGLGLVGSVRLGLHYCDCGLGFRFGGLERVWVKFRLLVSSGFCSLLTG